MVKHSITRQNRHMSAHTPQNSIGVFADQSWTYTDAHGVEISAYTWEPRPDRSTDAANDAPHGVVQIAHGIGEHAGRYGTFARRLTEAGFVVVADDHRGHGETGRTQHDGDLSQLGKLGPGGLRATEAAVLQLTGIIRERYPDLPVVMFGHSWGSLMAQRILEEHPRAWDAVVLSGSAFRTFRFMESGDLNTKWAAEGATGFEWLSTRPDTAETFIADELCFGADILKLFGVADGLRLYGKPGHGLAADVPMLIVSGAEDPLSRGDGLTRLAAAYRARGVRDVTLREYAGARHELLNEAVADEAMTDIVTWMLEHTDH